MRKLPLPAIALSLLLLPVIAGGQNAPPPPAPIPQLSPKAAYEDAVHPLELTRQAVSNWSDTEVAALTVSMAQAAKGCAARDPQSFTGADLIDLARLCAFGQNFNAVVDASTRYIAADGPKPLLTQAYAGLIDAQLHLKDEPSALASAKTMLAAVPYQSLTADTINEAIGFMHFVYTADALTLATARQPLLLNVIRNAAAQPSTATLGSQSVPGSADSGAEPPQSLHALYADGIALAALQQLSRSAPADISATLTSLNAALPSTLSPDDAIPISVSRRRYALLGKPLPNLAHPTHADKPVAIISLSLPSKLPQIPAPNAITALILFPDWCAQCIRMDRRFPQTVFTVSGHEAYLYGLLAQTVPPNPEPAKPSTAPTAFTPADAANLLQDTPTVIVDPSLLVQFAATDVPYLILMDSQGIVRVLQPVSEDAINPGGSIDSAIALVGNQWPTPGLLPKALPPHEPSSIEKAPSAAATH